MQNIYVILVDNPKFAHFDKTYIDALIKKGAYFTNLQTAENKAQEWTKLLGFSYKVITINKPHTFTRRTK